MTAIADAPLALKDNFAQQASLIDPHKLDKLAELCVKVGLNLHAGQDLILTAHSSALPFVRLIAKHAYQAGAALVLPFFGDEALALTRFEYAPVESFDKAANWLYEGMAKAFENGAARLAIVSDNPMLLAQQDSAKIARLNRANSLASKPTMEKITQFVTNWNIVAYPHLAWAQQVFPKLDEASAFRALSEAIFNASRVNDADPIAAWKLHNEILHKHANWLNEQRFTALHFKNAHSDITIGLADDHLWSGGASKAQNGIWCNPNIPTEEVFTTPHAYRVEGYVRASKPLSYSGNLIEDIQVRFEKGKIVEAKASKGQDVLERLLTIDEGASHLGEIALVPHSSPISQSGLLFYNTLFDENASCHIALGQCYAKCFQKGASLSQEEITQKGGNHSLIHIDWMIGTADTEIDGIKLNGERVAVFRRGEWA